MNLLISFRSEILKTKRTAALYFMLAGAAFVPMIFILNALTHGLPDEEKSMKDPLNAVFKLSTEMIGLGIFPIFVILICTLLPQIEHKNNTWKQVLTSPQTRLNIFFSKFLNIHLMMILFLVTSHLFMWLAAIAIQFIIPETDILHRPLDGTNVLSRITNTWLTILGVSAIQFWIGLRFKNFIVPIAIGIIFWLTGTVLALEYHSDLMYYFPYSFQVFGLDPEYKGDLGGIVWKSVGYALVFLGIGFVNFKKRRING